MVGFSPRNIIESPDFQAQRAEFLGVRMFDEVMAGIGWAIAKNPERFAVPGTAGLGVAITNPFPGIPQFRIMFTYDDHQARLHWIEPTEAEG